MSTKNAGSAETTIGAPFTAAVAYTPRQRRVVLLFAIVGALIESMELNLLSFPLADLAASFHVTSQAIVGVITVQSLASIVGGFFFGWLGDRWGRRPTYVTFTLIYGVFAVVGGLMTNFDLFVITRIIAGIAMGGAFGVIFAMFSESWKSTKRGLMGSVLQGMFIGGTLLTQVILYVTLSVFGSGPGWRVGFGVIGVVCLAISVAAWRWLPESTLWRAARKLRQDRMARHEHVVDTPEDGVLRGARLVRGSIFLTLVTTGVFAASYSYITFAPTFLRESVGLTLGPSTVVLTVGTLLGIISYLVFGSLSDHVGRRMATMYSCILGVLGFGVFAVFGTASVSAAAAGSGSSAIFGIAVVALMGTAVGYAGFGVLGTWISEFYPTRYRALGSGATYYVARGIGSGLFPLFALVIAGGNLHYALALGGIGAAVALVASLFVPDTAGRVISAEA